MLPSPIRLSGVVTDTLGKPIPGVWINHTGSRFENITTDRAGRFDIETGAPAVVFRGDGFQSRYWKVNQSGAITIALAPAPRAKACGQPSRCMSLEGFHACFCLPRIRGVKVSAQGNDVDYGQRLFQVKTRNGTVAIQHAAGGMWGSGLPFNEDVWSASEYSEKTWVDDKGFFIIDARGKSANGRCWRVLGHAFETASYRNVPEQDTVLLDRVLDGACVKPVRWPR